MKRSEFVNGCLFQLRLRYHGNPHFVYELQHDNNIRVIGIDHGKGNGFEDREPGEWRVVDIDDEGFTIITTIENIFFRSDLIPWHEAKAYKKPVRS